VAGSTPISSMALKSSDPPAPLRRGQVHRGPRCSSWRPRPCEAGPSPRAIDNIPGHTPCRLRSGRRPAAGLCHQPLEFMLARDIGLGRRCNLGTRYLSGSTSKRLAVSSDMHPESAKAPSTVPGLRARISDHASSAGSYRTNLSSQEPNEGCNNQGLTSGEEPGPAPRQWRQPRACRNARRPSRP
jgi:hypothetical protein